MRIETDPACELLFSSPRCERTVLRAQSVSVESHAIGESEDIQEVRCIFIELAQSAATSVRIIRNSTRGAQLRRILSSRPALAG